MIKLLKHISLILLACLVVTSTLSFSVHKHYCGAFLVDTSIMTPSKGCGMNISNDSSCPMSIKKDCCHDDSELLQGQDELKTPPQATINQLGYTAIITTNNYTYSAPHGYRSTNNHTNIYKPPLVLLDIQVWHQTFLI